MVPGKDKRVVDPDGWLWIVVGSGQDPKFFPWAHVGRGGILSLLAERRLTAWDASDATGHMS